MNIRSAVFLFVCFYVRLRTHRRKLISMMMHARCIEKRTKSSMPSIGSSWSSIKTMPTSRPGYAGRKAHGWCSRMQRWKLFIPLITSVRNTVRSTQCAVVWSKLHWLIIVLSSFRVGSLGKKVMRAEAAGESIQPVHPADYLPSLSGVVLPIN